MAERVTVEVGGFSGGVYHSSRLIKYDEDEAEVEAEARRLFKNEHGEPSEFGNFSPSVSFEEVEDYQRVLVEIGGYTRTVRGKPQRVRGYMAHRWRRVEHRPELRHATDKKRDTRGGERRRRR